MRYAWIEKHRQIYSTTTMCELLSVSRSGLNAARERAPSKRSLDDEQLVKQIRHSQHKHRGRYGRRRMTTEVSEAQGRPVNHKRVARVMQEHGLQSHKRRRFRVVTTHSKHAHPVAPNVLERDFEATAPNQKWLADMTYVPTGEGWLYLAMVLDLYARKLVGWAMSETMPQELTLCALDVALGCKGDCWDNAPMESVNGTLKVECVHDVHFDTREQARQAIVEYIGYYNTERRHSSLGNIAPAEFERRWRAEAKPKDQGVAPAKHRVTHRRPVSGSSQATEPAVRG